MWVEICLFLVLVLTYYVVKDRKPKGMPPGPFEWPFMGNRPPLETSYIMQLKKQYGNVVTTRIAHLRTVLVYDPQLAKEAMAAVDFADRPIELFGQFSLDDRKQGGVAIVNGAQWQHERRFMLRNLRNLGMGKSALEDAIHIEAEAIVEELKALHGKTVSETPFVFRTAALNMIWQLVAGKRYESNSKEVVAIHEITNRFNKESTSLSQAYFLFPEWLQNVIPKPIKVNVFRTDLVDEFFAQMRHIVEKHVDEGEEKLKDGYDGNDFICDYLRAMKEHDGEEPPLFWRGSLLQNVSDLFQAGTETTLAMLRWTVHLMAKHPKLTQEMQQEISDVTPHGQLVGLAHKENLPLVEAFCTEALRYSSFVTLNVQRSTPRDTKIGDFLIPKGTIVQAVNYAIHHDPAYWDAPHDFNPRRFITEEGKFRAPKDAFFAFGSGRRQCVGESLARMEYFLFSAAIIQNFNISVPDGAVINTDLDEVGGVRMPKDQPYLYEYRN